LYGCYAISRLTADTGFATFGLPSFPAEYVIDEGYIKFNAEWSEGPPPSWHKIRALNEYRQVLYDHGLIGALPEGIGFGNISIRDEPTSRFLITGSATGNFRELGPEHFTTVTHYDFDANSLRCRGPVTASSESLTHAAFYTASRAIGAVIHVHHAGLWNTWIDRLPTTSIHVTYGTPEMAYEVIRLVREAQKSSRPGKPLVIMGGHQDGVLAYGPTLGQATSTLLNCCDRLFRPER